MYSEFMGSFWFTILSALLFGAVCLTASRSLGLVDISDLDS